MTGTVWASADPSQIKPAPSVKTTAMNRLKRAGKSLMLIFEKRYVSELQYSLSDYRGILKADSGKV